MASTTTLARPSRSLDGPRGLLRDNPALVSGLAAIVVFLAMAGSEGGFYPIGSADHPGLGWYPAAALLLAILCASAIAVRPARPRRAVSVALGLLAAYTVWSFLSIAWAEQQGVAWDGANRTAIYLLVFALFALWPVTAGGATILLGALGLGLAGLGFVELLKADASTEPVLYFVDARLAEPAGYINANVALWTIGLFPCLYLAISREVNPLLRGLALGGAGVLACLALLGQSRGWVLAIPVAALAFVLFTPFRARALTALGTLALAVYLIRGPLLAVHDEFSAERLDGLLGEATRSVLVLALVLAVAGVVLAVADRRVSLPESTSKRVNRGALVALGIVLLVGAVAGVAKVGDPFDKASESWQSFKSGGDGTAAGSSRFSTVGTNRYDFWVVALDRFRERPLQGIGSENFQQDYLARGNSGEQPRYPHSLQIGVLSQTGLVGALLLGGALLAAGVAVLRSGWRANRASAAAAGGAAAVFAYWLTHASVDWFWEFAGVTAPAFAMLGLACALARKGPDERLPEHQGRARAALVGFVTSAAAATILLVSFVLPWLAEREVARAASGWPAAPGAAFDRLERAKALNPLSPRPHLVAATIAVRTEDQGRATAELERVLELEPRTPFALAEMAALASERGDAELAQRLLERANGYAPLDEVVRTALERVRSGGSIDVRELNSSYLKVARLRIGRE